MRVETPQILWNSEGDKGLPAALMSVDILESGLSVNGSTHTPTFVLVTAGNCSEIHLWKVQFADTASATGSIFQKQGGSTSKIEFLTALNRHDGPVSTVKFSPDGLHLATAGETGAIIIWSVPVEKRGNGNGQHYWSTVTREPDLNVKVATRAGDGVADLSWSSDSKHIMAGTIDHAVIILENDGYHTGGSSSSAMQPSQFRQVYRNASNHSHYVQGVACDPHSVYLASMSSDRTVRLMSRKVPAGSKAKKAILRDANGSVPPPEHAAAVQQLLSDAKLDINIKAKQLKYRKTTAVDSSSNKEEEDASGEKVGSSIKKQYLFADESTLESFVRRLAWTPDGGYLITPAAVWHGDGYDKSSYATLLFARHRWEEPAMVLSGLDKPSIAVRPNPLLFKLPEAEDGKENALPCMTNGLPYRSIFAVLTWDSVILYDTYHTAPLAVARGLHYANLVDATWTADGRTLIVCSTDGYVSILRFDACELGVVYTPPLQAAPFATKPQLAAAAVANPGISPAASPSTSSSRLPVQQGLPSLPPCESGTAAVEPPAAKRAKTRIVPTLIAAEDADSHKRPITETVAAVDKLSLDPQKKKKRVQLTQVL